MKKDEKKAPVMVLKKAYYYLNSVISTGIRSYTTKQRHAMERLLA